VAALTPVEISHLGSGWDNYAFLVNGGYVFRFPRREAALSCNENELRILRTIAGRLPLSVPNPIFLGEASAGFPWPFAGYRLVNGKTACAANLGNEERLAIAPDLGRFLRTFHNLPVEEMKALGAMPDPVRRLDLDFRNRNLERDLLKAQDYGLKPPDNWRDIIRAAKVVPAEPVLQHGDLYIRHLVVDDGRLTGVIDWGDCMIDHPAIDLTVAHSFLPPEAHAVFLDAYGPVDESTWTLARWRALQHTSMLALFANDTGDVDMRRECDRTYRYLEMAGHK